jgi:virulence factor Mce-like protein
MSPWRYVGTGAVVVVVLVGAVYVSWNSIYGLPLQSRYTVYVDVPNAEHLVPTDEVRIAGIRVGEVTQVSAEPASAGRAPFARVKLELATSVGRLPADTKVRVGLSAALGATYVQLTLGHSRRTIAAGGVVPLANTQPTVDLVDLLDVFDHSTAAGIRQSLAGLGAGFAGRGPALNDMLGALPRLLPAFMRVAQTLAAPATRLGAFLRGYEAFTATFAPVATPLAELLTGASATFGGMRRAGPALAATLDALPQAESDTTSAFTALQRPLDRLATLVTDLRGGGTLLPTTLHQVNLTLDAGIAPLRGAVPFSAALGRALSTLQEVTRQPATLGTMGKLKDLVTASGTGLEALTPAQLDCDVIGLYGTQFSKVFSMGGGEAQGLAEFDFINPGATGSILQNAKPSPNLGVNYLPTENASECASGREPAPGSNGPPQLSGPVGVGHAVPETAPPPGVTALAARAGLLNTPAGTPR